jgi:hypothetical protein
MTAYPKVPQRGEGARCLQGSMAGKHPAKILRFSNIILKMISMHLILISADDIYGEGG